MAILITGANGLIGTPLTNLLRASGIGVIACSKQDFDVTNIKECDWFFIPQVDLVIHCAAITSVDYAEKNKEEAYKINYVGTRNIAQSCAKYKVPMFFLSSCAVFDGAKVGPYTEEDQTNPLSYYAQTKVLAENCIREILPETYTILRSNYVYGKTRPDFVTQVIHRLKTEDCPEIKVIPQVISPVRDVDLCRVMMDLINGKHFGTYHYNNRKSTSRENLVRFLSLALERESSTIECDDFKNRPLNTVLDTSKIEPLLSQPIPHWSSPLADFIIENY